MIVEVDVVRIIVVDVVSAFDVVKLAVVVDFSGKAVVHASSIFVVEVLDVLIEDWVVELS